MPVSLPCKIVVCSRLLAKILGPEEAMPAGISVDRGRLRHDDVQRE